MSCSFYADKGINFEKLNPKTITLNGTIRPELMFSGWHHITLAFRLPVLKGESKIKNATSLNFSLKGYEENADINSTEVETVDVTADKVKGAAVYVYKNNVLAADGEKYDITSRYNLEVTFLAGEGYTFYGATKDDITVAGLGKPTEVSVSAGGGLLMAKFNMPSLMGEHEHVESNYISNSLKHSKESTLCYKVLSENEHVYDDDNDAICNVCSYERVLSVKSVKLNVTGYESGALIPQIKVAPTADSKGVDWNEDFCKYGTNGTYLISLNLLESVLYRELLIPEYETAYFMPNKQYYLSVYIFAKDGYSLENLSEENVNLSCGGTVGRYNKRRWSRRGRLLCKRRFYNVL